MPNTTFESIPNRAFYGDNIRNDIWGFTGKAKDCQDICAAVQGCKAFVWKQWLCRLLHSIQNYMCVDEAMSGKIVDESGNRSSDTNGLLIQYLYF